MGLRRGCLCLYCAGDGTADASTPEQLRDELAALGWESAVMLDGGGSSQCDLNGAVIRASRRVHNWICVYLKHEAARPPEQEEKPMGKYVVCLDPGHGPTTVNGSPDGSYKEHEFAWDMYERIAPILEGRGVAVVVTKAEGEKPSLTDRAAVSNRAGAACLVSLHSNAFGSGGWTSAQGLEIYTSAGPETAARNVLRSARLSRFRAAGVKIRQEPVKHNLNLTVLVQASAPACLIEYGYHTNEEDVSLLKSDAYRDKLARGHGGRDLRLSGRGRGGGARRPRRPGGARGVGPGELGQGRGPGRPGRHAAHGPCHPAGAGLCAGPPGPAGLRRRRYIWNIKSRRAPSPAPSCCCWPW